jgi:hypothetical protein
MCKLVFDENADASTIQFALSTASWCNGNTGDSESLVQGSSPCEATTLFWLSLQGSQIRLLAQGFVRVHAFIICRFGATTKLLPITLRKWIELWADGLLIQVDLPFER